MQDLQRAPGAPTDAANTAFAVLDEGMRVAHVSEHLPGISASDAEELKGKSAHKLATTLLGAMKSVDGEKVRRGPADIKAFLARWASGSGSTIMAETGDGGRKLLTSHPNLDGGVTLLCIDIATNALQPGDASQDAEISRRIADSHPLPVWVADEETGEILYESLEASRLLGRTWTPDAPQFITDHYVRTSDRDEVREMLASSDLLRDYEVEFKKTDGTRFWISANVRRGTYDGRKVLVAGVLDVTGRREVEKHFKSLMESHPMPVWANDAETGEIIYRSRAAEKIFGAKPDGGKLYVKDFFEDPEQNKELLRELQTKGRVERYEVKAKTANDSTTWISGGARLVKYSGRPIVLSGIMDVTELKLREQELSDARQRLSDAIESLSEGFALFDADSRLVMCNEVYRQMNSEASELLKPGVKWVDFLKAALKAGQFEDARGREAAWLKQRLKGIKGHGKPIEFRQSDGRWYSATSSPTQDGGFVVTRTDVTERKRAEQLEREADAMVRQVLESCPVMIMMNDVENGEIIYRSPATVPMFGEPESVRSFYADPNDRTAYLAELKEKGFVDNYQYEARRPNGETFPASVSGRLIDFQGRQVIVSHTQDLSTQVAIEEELARQREIVHQSEKLSALGELLAGVAHELNNPLSVVVGQSLLLKETAEDQRIKDRADKIGSAADRCARIVKSFLAMARQQPARTESFNVNEVLEAALEVTGYSIRSSDIDVTLRLAPEMPAVTGDPDQLGQVFSNLLINAQQVLSGHSGRRKIKIVTRYERHRSAVIIKIADTGPGIPKHIVSRIFEPFFTTKEVGSGTGIGLAFCHRIVESHDGVIRATSKLGEGTAFFIRLPAAGGLGDDSTDEAADQASSDKLSVLVVDDEADVAELIREILEQEGHKVTMANSGARALREIARQNFSIILSDLNMPNLDGPTLFAELQEGYPELVSRIAFITGDTMSPKARSFLNSAGRPYLDKPIRPADLRALVVGLMDD